MRARPGVLSFLVALGTTLGLGALFLFATMSSPPPQGPGPNTRPPVPITVAFDIDYAVSDGLFLRLHITEQGNECHYIEASRRLYEACVLAVNVEPAAIAGDAGGRLNTEYTASFEAIVWRARLSEGAAFCRRAGLTGRMASRCEALVRRPRYEVSDSGVTVRIP